MTSPQRRAEAAAASSTFHVAMAQLGARAFAEVLELWADVVPTTTRAATTSAKFVNRALQLVRLRRHQVQAITVPYLRLVRALHTGYTSQPIFTAEPTPVPLDRLREDFVGAVERFAPEALQSGRVEDYFTGDSVDDSTEISEPDGSTYRPYRPEAWGEYDDILTEEIDRLTELLDQQEAAAEAEAQAVLDSLSRDLLTEKLKKLELEELSAQEADKRQESEGGKVGRLVAAHAERLVQNGGRHTEDAVARSDSRVIGYVRVHYPEGDPEPCSFCAMLISRGVVYKKQTSDKRSTRDNVTWQLWRKGFEVPGAEFDKYHVLCHCRGEAVYSTDQVDEDSRFQVNRELGDLWKTEIAEKGFTGKDAEAKWRELIKARNIKSRQERGGTEHAHAHA